MSRNQPILPQTALAWYFVTAEKKTLVGDGFVIIVVIVLVKFGLDVLALEMEPRASQMSGKHPTTEPYPQHEGLILREENRSQKLKESCYIWSGCFRGRRESGLAVSLPFCPTLSCVQEEHDIVESHSQRRPSHPGKVP